MEKIIKTQGESARDNSVAVYEVSYLLLPSLAIEQVPHEVDLIKKTISSRGGAIISDENPFLIDLAYSMVKVVGTTRHKCESGYFGWVKFEISREGILEVKKMLDTNDLVLRHLIIKTVRENTLVGGKMNLKKEDKAKGLPATEDEVVDEAVIPKEVAPDEIDKSIDDLVIV